MTLPHLNPIVHFSSKTKGKKGPLSCKGPYYISIGCRGYYSAERDNPANDMTKFRKITRITVSGRSDVAKEVIISLSSSLFLL